MKLTLFKEVKTKDMDMNIYTVGQHVTVDKLDGQIKNGRRRHQLRQLTMFDVETGTHRWSLISIHGATRTGRGLRPLVPSLHRQWRANEVHFGNRLGWRR